jgi:protein-disulfide isomerase
MMVRRLLFVSFATLMPSVVAAQGSEAVDLQKEIGTIKATQLAIQKDIQELKAMLQRPAPPPPPAGPAANATLSLQNIVVRGSTAATAAIVEFADYECPFCGRHATLALPEIRREYVSSGKIRYAFVDFPLEIHPHAFKAAEAVLCAGGQNKYWEMHDRLLENQNALSASDLASHAAAI